MVTSVLPITKENIERAKELVTAGEVVAIPTETVYGLGGSAFDDNAVKRIFEVKGRPNDNPLIAHVHADYDLSKIIDYDPPCAKLLRKKFLPGPLTLVYPSTGKVSPYVSCGLNTLAVRVPAHVGAQAFLKAVDIPVVAPSANLSRHVSPTSAAHVYDDFAGKIPLILDGGEAVGGIESTVLDVSGEIPMLLRPGLVTKEEIERALGYEIATMSEPKQGERVKSPGVLYKHYSPRCPTKLFKAEEKATALQACLTEKEKGVTVAVLAEEGARKYFEERGFAVLSLGSTPQEMAASLYARLREAEQSFQLLVAIEPNEQGGVMTGVMNRLRKACTSSDVAH
ncbi:MAG: threonylcarbamoyl-AMP synthase [Clostridia bacterium]|nr:threonylcarbamoyl-AMP synthase [Clostridia bacterium]